MFRKILEFIKRNFSALCTYALVFIAGYSNNPWVVAICIVLCIALIMESEKE